MEELDRLLDKVLTLEHNVQMKPGPQTEDGTSMPTVAEFLELCEVVGTMLELMGAEPRGGN